MSDAPPPVSSPPPRQKGLLGAVERLGNLLPEPVMIFVWLILGLMVLSAIGQALGWSASITYAGDEAPQFGELENGFLTYAANLIATSEPEKVVKSNAASMPVKIVKAQKQHPLSVSCPWKWTSYVFRMVSPGRRSCLKQVLGSMLFCCAC
jgi:hypothetical protein